MPTSTVTMPSSMTATQQPLSCVIVEDQGMFLDLLVGMMTIRRDIRIVAQARDVAEGCTACVEHRPDVLILDLALPDGDGVEVARRFTEANPKGRVIVVSGQTSDFVCPAWLDGNLQAVISKNQAFDSLRLELDEITDAGSRGAGDAKRLASLSPREAEIFGLIGTGLNTRAIAKRLELSEHTVQSHRKRIAAKLRTIGDEVVRLAIVHRTIAFRDAPG